MGKEKEKQEEDHPPPRILKKEGKMGQGEEEGKRRTEGKENLPRQPTRRGRVEADIRNLP